MRSLMVDGDTGTSSVYEWPLLYIEGWRTSQYKRETSEESYL